METEIEQKPAKAIKATKPGWKPASVLPNLKARPGFTARWIRNDAGNIARKKAEGWIPMTAKDNVGVAIEDDTATGAQPLTNVIRYQDMIGMMLPDDLKQARQEYHRNENQNAVRGVMRETDEKMKDMGVATYAPKGHRGRIVID